MAIEKGIYEITVVSTGMALDVPYMIPMPGNILIQFPVNHGANQRWAVTPLADGTYQIRSQLPTQPYLAAPSGTGRGQPLVIWPATGNADQKWHIEDKGGGKHYLRNAGSKRVADVFGNLPFAMTPIIQWVDNGQDNQFWRFAKVS